jgi:hypothetical protein
MRLQCSQIDLKSKQSSGAPTPALVLFEQQQRSLLELLMAVINM